MSLRKSSLQLVILVVLAVLVALPALARDRAITNGIDLWQTPANGGTFVDFARQPLPAGFFCASSAPFTGRVVFSGVPIKTKPAGALGNADTIIQRLDDAVFTRGAAFAPFKLREAGGSVRDVDASAFQGQEVAVTRLQAKAISFAGTRPVQTGCGGFTVTASLAGEQPITEMVIVRDRNEGGRFFAPLSLNVKLTFTPTRGGAPVEVMRNIQFPAKPLSVWTEKPDSTFESFVSVDSDADGRVDIMLPGTSNFAAGFKDLPSRGRNVVEKVAYVPYCGGSAEYYAEHCHATGPILVDSY